MDNSNVPGTTYDMQLLEPLSWIEQNDASAGRCVYLSLPELGVSGRAQVMSVSACPTLENGPGRVVLGTFTSISRDVIELRLSAISTGVPPVDAAETTLDVTTGHPLWLLDRGDWVPAGSLSIGERVATEHGEATVESIAPVVGEQRVYNLDVEGDHRYLVGEIGAVAHNATPNCVGKPFVGTLRGKPVHYHGTTTVQKNFVKRDPTVTEQLRTTFNSTARKQFVKDLASDPLTVAQLRSAGISPKQIAAMRNDGTVPGHFQVHHKVPLDAGGTNDSPNLILIAEEYHYALSNEQNWDMAGMSPGDSKSVLWPEFTGSVYW